MVLIWLPVILHSTALRFWFDPIQGVREWRLVQTAETSVQKANAYLTLAEARFEDFKDIHQDNSRDGRLSKLTDEMVEYDQKAMSEMDRAKKAGVDIKPLVKRLCDGLEEQYEELKLVKHAQTETVGQLHERIELVEANLGKSTVDVKKALDDAMMW